MTPAEARRAIALLDLTSLNDADDDAAALALCRRAVTPFGPAAAVCLWPRFVALARDALAGTGVKVATVVNFPHGEDAPDRIAAATRGAVADGADEIDVVAPWRRFLAGDAASFTEVLAACRAACDADLGDFTSSVIPAKAGIHLFDKVDDEVDPCLRGGDDKKVKGRVRLKVILESGAFDDAGALRAAADLALAAGADFLKTSTGKREPGATPDAMDVFYDAILAAGVRAGVKASGGVRTAEQAQAYLAQADARMGPDWAAPATFRFGASALLDALLAVAGRED